jgi:O-antigen ligase
VIPTLPVARVQIAVRTAPARFAPGFLSFAILVSLGLAGGGYLPRAWRLAGFALFALAAAALISRLRVVVAGAEWCFLLGLGALAGWTAISTLWSDDPATSWLESERDLVYVAAVVAVFLIARRSSVFQLLAGAAAGVTAVSAYGLGTYVIFDHPLNPIEGKLLFEPIGYANGFGIYTAVGIVLSVGLGLATREKARLLALSSLAVLVPTLYLTGSRGAWLATGAGLIVLLAFQWRGLPRFAAILGPLAVIAAVLVALTSNPGGLAANLAGDNRPHYWHVAWRQYQSNPLLGSGAGTFDEYWLRSQPTSFARDAHSLYLETLAELGPVGLVLLLATLGLPLLALRRRRDPLAVAAAGGYVTFLVHAGIDWDWELPAVTLAGLFCGAALLIAARPQEAEEITLRSRVGLLALALFLAGFTLFRLENGPPLPFAS